MRAALAFSVFLSASAARSQTPAPATPPPPPPRIETTHGSTKGLVDKAPDWSAGVQLGTAGGSGASAQVVGFKDGALVFGLGVGGGAVSIYGDYLLFLDGSFHVTAVPEGGYNQIRGEVMPYFGFGINLANGVALRLPLGIQYVMLRDPLAFFGGVTLVYGEIDRENDKLDFRAQALAGVRLLL